MRQFIVGTDWWTDCDDAVAMRILARAHLKGEIRILGVGINACMEHSVSSLDAFLRQEGLCDLPMGIDLAATDFGRNPPYQKRLAENSIGCRKNEEVEDAVKLYRRLLAQAEGPVEIIEIGYTQVLSGLLESHGDEISSRTGLELVKEKVPKLWMMAGRWSEEDGWENNFARNERARIAGEIVCRLCPVPITFLGWEVGCDVITGSRLPEDDVLHQVLCDHGSPNGRMSWDPMLVVLALAGDEEAAGYDLVRGTACVNPETGTNRFVPSADGLHGYVVRKRGIEYYQDQIDELITAR